MVRDYSPLTQPDQTHNLPPLQSGDRLTRPEFERRYGADPHIKKAELIEGIVYVASPLRHEQHIQLSDRRGMRDSKEEGRSHSQSSLIRPGGFALHDHPDSRRACRSSSSSHPCDRGVLESSEYHTHSLKDVWQNCYVLHNVYNAC